jgi:hypothetical protein
MENVTIIAGEIQYNMYYTSIIELPPDRQRRFFYGNLISSFEYITRKETDTHIYWAVSNKIPKHYNNKLFYHHKHTQGVTYDKQTKNVKIWFGEKYYNLSNIIIHDIYKVFKIDWINTVPMNIQTLINNTIFTKIIKGKITDLRGLCLAYFKTSPYKHRDVNVDLFIETFTKNMVSPKAFTEYFLIAEDCNDMLKFIIDNTDQYGGFYNYSLDIFIRNAIILDRPVDFKTTQEKLLELDKDYSEIIKKQDIIYEFFKENKYD